MTTENELITKSYYREMLDETKQGHAVKILGEMYMEKMQEAEPDVSTIRFAQGEVYFQNSDYEAAIFKWQQPMKADLIPWAHKNIGDAHMEMGLLEEAKKVYRKVETTSLALKTEVLLQLFSLYNQQSHQEEAIRTVREAVKLNPDYPHVTESAQIYFEDIEEWAYAIELALGEALRTESSFWFDTLTGYVERGLTVSYEPVYFRELLEMLRHTDKERFEQFIEVLWDSYRESERYLQWVEMVNELLGEMEALSSYEWERLPRIHNQGYADLISGQYFIREIKGVVQALFPNWVQISEENNALVPAAAVLAWSEMFPSALDMQLVSKAESLFEHAQVTDDNAKDGIELVEAIQIWAGREGLLDDLSAVTRPMMEGYNLEVASPTKIRDIVKTSIEFLQEQKEKLEASIEQEIDRNGGLLTTLHDVHSQLGEIENDIAPSVTDSFSGIKTSLVQEMKKDLPTVLKNCSSLINEESDFTTLQNDLNEEMNKRMNSYMSKYISDYMEQTVQDWLADCQTQFDASQTTMDELSADLNGQMYHKEVLLEGDFKVLEDWRRDLERMSRSLLRIDKINFMMRNTPSQLFLKGAGKLFDSMSKNKEKLQQRYQSYIENTDFTPFIEKAIAPFQQQLELFEESIEWDVERFFASAFETLNHEMEKVQAAIEMHQNSLDKMQEQPEVYQNPLTLFELRLRQYELMHTIS